MAQFVVSLAMLAALATSEIAWWEGQWIEQGVSCSASSGDARPLSFSAERMRFGEAECTDIREKAVGRKLLLMARCLEHGDPAVRPRTFTLQPSQGGWSMIMAEGEAVWHLRKCPTSRAQTVR